MPEAWRGLSLALRAVLVGGLLLALLLLGTCRQRALQAGAEARAAREAAMAGAAAGRAAVGTVAANGAATAAEEAITRDNAREISDATGADATVDAGVGGAGLDGLCRRAAYRDHARCRVRGAGAR
ncbi:hypothetical protein [Sphingomicrobium aestuariivivum]|uniref:hypothetical protein n=1 Tax=Sphingomicrobium aestuariivivum TaxID=1582356 RepID=UPI001FD7077C|nr:hypothetical protein [Sphingomicrobium aestuariivivum]MCJ8190841.1 hypothetical protein [Sphingomicrobium aestuariivivum]